MVDGNQTKEVEMKINEVITREDPYSGSPFAMKMARLGQKMQRLGQGTGEPGSLAKMSDDELDRMNKLGDVGGALTSVGAPMGVFDPGPAVGAKKMSAKDGIARMIKDVSKQTGIDPAKVNELIKYAQEAEDINVTKKVPDPEPEDEPDDMDQAPDDDAIARQADRRARGA